MNKNYELKNLKALLRFKNISYAELGEALGISKGSVSEKINNRAGRSFTILEAMEICEYLDINNEDIHKYFFGN